MRLNRGKVRARTGLWPRKIDLSSPSEIFFTDRSKVVLLSWFIFVIVFVFEFVCRLHLFVFDSHLATLWESNCPFGFLLVMFSVISCLCFFRFDVSDGRCGIIVSIPDHCLPFYFSIQL